MHARRSRSLPLALVGLAILGILGWLLASVPRRSAAPTSSPTAERAAASNRGDRDRAGRAGDRGAWARYRLHAEHDAAMSQKQLASNRTTGTWTATEREGGLTQVDFAAREIAQVGDTAPQPAELAAPILLATRDGVLSQIGFAPGMTDAAKNLLTSLATTIQLTVRPGTEWTAEEEDLTGRYQARYTREDDRIHRTRGVYTRLRGPSGLDGAGAAGIEPDEESEFVVDRRGVVSATVKLALTIRAARGVAPLEIRTTATLVREDAADLVLAAAPPLSLEPITARVDRKALARHADEQLVAGASTTTLLADALAAAHAEGTKAETQKARSSAVRRLAAQAALDPAAPGHIADAIRRSSADRELVTLLAGALSSSASPAATQALASLVKDPLPDAAREQVLLQLGLSNAPSPSSVAALTSALDGPQSATAALALGSEVRHLGGDPSAEDAIGRLLERYAAVATPAERRAALAALGNTASHRVLAVLEEAVRDPDLNVAREAAFDLRLIPGDDVDDFLYALIQSGTPVTFEAISATGYRSSELWEPRLQSFAKVFSGHKRVVDAIEAVLGRWKQGQKGI